MQTLGALLGISTMAAAALGNIISDVAGVGLAHYVELLVARLGFQQPELTPRQVNFKRKLGDFHLWFKGIYCYFFIFSSLTPDGYA